MRRVGVGLADLGIAVLGGPDHLAGLGIECHQRGIGLLQQDLAVAVGQAAVDGVAAHHRHHVVVLLGFVFPLEGLVLQVDRDHLVRERRMDVHRIADHQRRAFMAPQHTGGHRPGDLQVLDVALVDLLQLAVAVVGIVARLRRPVGRVGDQLVQLRVRACRK
ncbi:hypothetical protein D3C72_1745690 [compost metagenome]